jgi:tripartite-type tricarboxylate transporter receptor subunit TctC
MKLDRRHFLLFPSMSVLPIVSSDARAQDYPQHPIRLVIPYPPGGIVDAVGRPWAERMKSLLGTVVVENIGGSGGEIGTLAVSRAAPDGYTILLGNSSVLVINPLARTAPSYDPVTNFDAVAIVGYGAQAMAINPSLPVHTLRELVDYAKRNSGKLSYGTPGLGTLSHLTGERFKLLIGAPDIVHVPYRGAGPAIADLIGGQIQMAIPVVNGQLLAFHRAGKIRILAVTSARRLRGALDLPTVVEAGMPDLVAQATLLLMVPRDTSRQIIKRLSQATKAALVKPDLQQIYAASGIEPSTDTSPEFATQWLKSEIVRWTPIIKQIGFKLD